MSRFYLFLLALVLLAGCGEAPAPAAKQPPASTPPTDEARRFPAENRVKIELVPDHLLGKAFLPGGNLAEYKLPKGGKPYQQFLVGTGTPAKASYLLLDYKNDLQSPKYMAHIGGYFGSDGPQPVYVFAKGRFLAGFVGLTEAEAEPMARRFAVALF